MFKLDCTSGCDSSCQLIKYVVVECQHVRCGMWLLCVHQARLCHTGGILSNICHSLLNEGKEWFTIDCITITMDCLDAMHMHSI